jgi:hypothetical protein
LLAAVALVVFSGALAAQQPALPTPRELLDQMSTHVMRISPSLERDRWWANVSLWEARLNHKGKPSDTILANMRTNISQIAAPGEAERWRANLQLWASALQ